MGLSDFLKQKEAKKKNNEKKSNKGDFREKCRELLLEIKELNNSRYEELNKLFGQKFNSINIQKKKILGFYGQLKHELQALRSSAGQSIKTTTKRVATKTIADFKDAVENTKTKVTQKADEIADVVKKTKTKKKTAKKKTAKKKTDKKKAAKKKTDSKKKKATKTVAKKKTKTTKAAASKKKTVSKKKTAKKK